MKIKRLGLIILVMVVLTSNIFAESINFKDIKEDNWFYDDVMELVGKGSIKGYSDNTFRPNDNITFAEFLNLVMKAKTGKNYPAKEGEHWASGVYDEALKLRIIDKDSFSRDKESLNKFINREDMAYILINIDEILGKEEKVWEKALKDRIIDYNSIDDLRKSHVLQAYKKGLIGGKETGFDPKGRTTRAEASTVVIRLLNKQDRLKIDEKKDKIQEKESVIMEQLRKPEVGEEIAVLKTNFGEIKLRLFPEIAPKAVENFTTHSKNGYYEGLIFHRVMDDFMIQGGDPTGTGMGGESIWGKNFEDEFHADYKNVRGALSMANAGPGTNGSQFFIVQKDETPWLNGAHTVFGQVFEGMDIVDKIAATEVGMGDKPVEDVVIETISIEEMK